MFAHGETITRLRAPLITDRFNDEVPDWALAVEFEVTGWGVDDSKSGVTLEVGRAAVITDFVLYRQEPADITANDRIIVRGKTCRVEGNPAGWRNPFTGWNAGCVVLANIVEG